MFSLRHILEKGSESIGEKSNFRRACGEYVRQKQLLEYYETNKGYLFDPRGLARVDRYSREGKAIYADMDLAKTEVELLRKSIADTEERFRQIEETYGKEIAELIWKNYVEGYSVKELPHAQGMTGQPGPELTDRQIYRRIEETVKKAGLLS